MAIGNNLSENDIKTISELYSQGNWDKIKELYPDVKRNYIYTLMSKLNIKNEKYFWTKEEVQYLIDNFGKMSYADFEKHYNGRHKAKAVSTKAIKLNLTKSQFWTQDEIDILINNYSLVPMDDIVKMIPTRSKNAIILKAVQLGIKSYYWLNEKYTQEEIDFIADNFGVLTDKEIAEHLGKTSVGIAEQRHKKLNLYYIDKEYGKYENLSKMLRGQIWQWKDKSMEKCNYQCIFTGSKRYIIHHLVSFNTILKETFDDLSSQGKLKGDKLQDYTIDELNYIIELFKKHHEQYPLGVCIRNDIHNLFHSIYGSGGNTIEQWKKFKENYFNHKFEEKYYI